MLWCSQPPEPAPLLLGCTEGRSLPRVMDRLSSEPGGPMVACFSSGPGSTVRPHFLCPLSPSTLVSPLPSEWSFACGPSLCVWLGKGPQIWGPLRGVPGASEVPVVFCGDSVAAAGTWRLFPSLGSFRYHCEQTPDKGWSGLREHVQKPVNAFFMPFFYTLEPNGGFEMAAH